ncbi:MAG: type II secretion system protein, partial [Eubacteriales bacterium]|nr:type II secretion system protein [Eubacteriales bacterium]
MLKLRKNKKGFTLVELIVVIAIMAVLAGTIAGVTVSQLNKQTNNTAKSEAQTLVSDFRNFMIDYTLPAPGEDDSWKEGDKVSDDLGLTQAVKDFIKDNQQEDKLFLVEG